MKSLYRRLTNGSQPLQSSDMNEAGYLLSKLDLLF